MFADPLRGGSVMPSTPTARRMARLVAQWRRTNESQASFARRHHIPASTLWYWCRKLAREAAPPAPRSVPAFVPVDVASQPRAPVIEVVFRGGERLQIGADASPALVQAVLTTLRAAC
jgi:transposase-like protein